MSEVSEELGQKKDRWEQNFVPLFFFSTAAPVLLFAVYRQVNRVARLRASDTYTHIQTSEKDAHVDVM